MVGGKCTKTGRVVYNRKKHYWNMRDLVRIIDAIEGDDEMIAKYPIQTKYVLEIMQKSIFPVVAHNFVTNITLRDYLKRRKLYKVVREIWQVMTKAVTAEVLKDIGVPVAIRRALLEYLFDILYDIIEGIFA